MSIDFFPPLGKRSQLTTVLGTLVPFALSFALSCGAGAQEAPNAHSIPPLNVGIPDAGMVITPLPPNPVATLAALLFSVAPFTDGVSLAASASDDSVMHLSAPALNDDVLARQRGGRAGMITVAVTRQVMGGGNAVTLWDEIAPPRPRPVPVDSGHATQGNAATYTRK